MSSPAFTKSAYDWRGVAISRKLVSTNEYRITGAGRPQRLKTKAAARAKKKNVTLVSVRVEMRRSLGFAPVFCEFILARFDRICLDPDTRQLSFAKHF